MNNSRIAGYAFALENEGAKVEDGIALGLLTVIGFSEDEFRAGYADYGAAQKLEALIVANHENFLNQNTFNFVTYCLDVAADDVATWEELIDDEVESPDELQGFLQRKWGSGWFQDEVRPRIYDDVNWNEVWEYLKKNVDGYEQWEAWRAENDEQGSTFGDKPCVEYKLDDYETED